MKKETKKIVLPDGWEIDKVEGNEIILKESKKELPKTWEDCIETFNKTEYLFGNDVKINPDKTANYKYVLPIGLGKPILALCQLLVCREVYRQG